GYRHADRDRRDQGTHLRGDRNGRLTMATASDTGSRLEAGVPVRLAGVEHGYGGLEVLAEVSLTAAAGEVVGVVGPSGCGKSTLLRLIAGLETPSQGSVHAAPAALMPQKDLLMPWRRALDNASIALENASVRKPEARARARELFARFGLERFAGAHT